MLDINEDTFVNIPENPDRINCNYVRYKLNTKSCHFRGHLCINCNYVRYKHLKRIRD